MAIIEKLENSLVQIGDCIEISPMEGRKRTKKLNRTLIRISLNRGGEEFFGPQSFKLKSIKSRGTYILKRVEERGLSYFKLSAEGEPFLVNGTLVESCILKRGDVIDLDYNRLTFLNQKVKSPSLMGVESWPREASFYIEGETGVGKSTLAKNLHEAFVGLNQPFIGINPSAFSESLIESELFGHEKGAFTGAVREKRGAVELAKGGTLFIDEIDSLPLHLQVKLLTFLDDQSFRRVGGEVLKSANCRIVFASGSCLRKLVTKGEFRSDLYFRIMSGMTFKISPLRNDPEKLEVLLKQLCSERAVTLDNDLRTFYLNQRWPGNIRQLRSHFLRKCLKNTKQTYLKLDEIDAQLLPVNIFLEEKEDEMVATLEQVKRDYCSKVFLNSQGSYELASRKLGIAISTLRRMLVA